MPWTLLPPCNSPLQKKKLQKTKPEIRALYLTVEGWGQSPLTLLKTRMETEKDRIGYVSWAVGCRTDNFRGVVLNPAP